jgi:hypothetical protein
MPQLVVGAALLTAGLAFLVASQRGPSRPPPLGAAGLRARSRLVPRVRHKVRRAFARGRAGAASPSPSSRAGTAATTGWRRLALPLAFLAAVGSGYAVGRSDLPPVTRVLAGAMETPTPPPATAPPTARTASGQATAVAVPGDRADCAAIHGTDYRSQSERTWYLSSCHELDGVTVTVWTVPEAYCRQGLAFTAVSVDTASSLDASAQGRTFCLDDSLLLAREGVTMGGPFGCPAGRKVKTVASGVAIGSRQLSLTELVCEV